MRTRRWVAGWGADRTERLGSLRSKFCRQRSPRRGAAYAGSVSVAEQTPEPHVMVLPPDEAVRRARPLPDGDEFALADITDDEWDAFQQALAER